MKASRLTALGLVVGSTLWIASGHLLPHETAESSAAVRPSVAAAQKPFRVAVIASSKVPHVRKLMLSGRTEADKKVTITARTGGVLTELKVHRGSHVKKGDVVAVLSDDAREAQVMQARSLVAQRQAELDAKRQLIMSGAMPKLDLVALKAQLASAKATLAAAENERERGIIRAPWDGVISDLPAEIGKAAFSFTGSDLMTLVSPDPMLAVAEVSERRLGGIKVGEMAEVRLVTGETEHGRIRYVSKTASPNTRTYRVEVELPNADGHIPDGITADIAVPLAPQPATRIPRSALTIASNGDIGVRAINAANKVGFVPVGVAEDDQRFMWVTGIPDGARVIVQGQDFVREGQTVEPVEATDLTASAGH
jgi:multidrug efflux system membrane fusion protein